MDFITVVVGLAAAAFVIGAGAMLALAIGWFIDSWRGLVRRFQRPADDVTVALAVGVIDQPIPCLDPDAHHMGWCPEHPDQRMWHPGCSLDNDPYGYVHTPPVEPYQGWDG